MKAQRGMTLVELLVAMAIGLGVTLAITSLLIAGDNHKRITTSTNDAEQTGAYAFYALDKVLRGAGSDLAETTFPQDHGVLNCKLNVAGILPRATAFPPPFAGFLGGAASTLTVAPLVIGSGQSAAGSDVIMVMGGAGAGGGVSRQVTVAGTATSMTLDNAVGLYPSDVVLVSQPGVPDCLIEQVNSVATPVLTLATTDPYYTTGTTTTISTLSGSTASYVTPLGNAAANNIQFSLYGVGANRTLYSYDLLQNVKLVSGSGALDAVQAIADGVDQMHAIYGLDTNGDGKQDTWVSPAAAPYDAATVMTTPPTQLQIVSVRVALVVRGEYYDKNLVSPASLTYFAGLTDSAGNPLPALKQTIALSSNDQHYRYRIFEFTVPLRNMILLAGGP